MPRGRNSNVDDDWLNHADEAVARQHLLAAREHYRRGAEELWEGGLDTKLAARHAANVGRRTVRDTAEDLQARLIGERGSVAVGELEALREKARELYNSGEYQVNVLRSQQHGGQLDNADPSARSLVRRRKSRLEAAIDGATAVGTAAAIGTGIVEAAHAYRPKKDGCDGDTTTHRYRHSRFQTGLERAVDVGVITALDMGLIYAGTAYGEYRQRQKMAKQGVRVQEGGPSQPILSRRAQQIYQIPL
ncbi:hypothetical protein JCM5296_004130 [Sporobolomyces johnsonii]